MRILVLAVFAFFATLMPESSMEEGFFDVCHVLPTYYNANLLFTLDKSVRRAKKILRKTVRTNSVRAVFCPAARLRRFLSFGRKTAEKDEFVLWKSAE